MCVTRHMCITRHMLKAQSHVTWQPNHVCLKHTSTPSAPPLAPHLEPRRIKLLLIPQISQQLDDLLALPLFPCIAARVPVAQVPQQRCKLVLLKAHLPALLPWKLQPCLPLQLLSLHRCLCSGGQWQARGMLEGGPGGACCCQGCAVIELGGKKVGVCVGKRHAKQLQGKGVRA